MKTSGLDWYFDFISPFSYLQSAKLDAFVWRDGHSPTDDEAFGVPSAVIDGDVFWGVDATPMVLARLRDDPFFASPALATARNLPQGVQRPR